MVEELVVNYLVTHCVEEHSYLSCVIRGREEDPVGVPPFGHVYFGRGFST